MTLGRLICNNLRQGSLTSFRNGTSYPISRSLPQHLADTLNRQKQVTRVMSTLPQLVVKPEGQLLVDDKLEIKITGLRKHQKITLHAVIRDSSGVFESCCCFTADDKGEVNLATQPSLRGSYTGTHGRTLFDLFSPMF